MAKKAKVIPNLAPGGGQVVKERHHKKRLKLNVKNYRSTSNWIVTFIFIFRILMVIGLIFIPIAFAVCVTADLGVKSLVFYIMAWWLHNANDVLAMDPFTAAMRWIPIAVWAMFGAGILFVYFIPFFASRSKGHKGFNAFWFMLMAGLGYGSIYGMQFFIIKQLDTTAMANPNPGTVELKALFFQDMRANFKYDNSWMIIMQVIHGFTFLFGVWSAIESDLIRRGKLSYDDLIVNYDKANSLANKVFSGDLTFGEVPDEDLRLSLHKLKNKLNIDKALDEEKRIKYVMEHPNEQDATEYRRQFEHSELESDIKEE